MHRSVVACCRVGGTKCSSRICDLLKEVTIIFITSTIVWPQVNSREGTQLHPSTESCISNLLGITLPVRTRPSFPVSPCLPSGSFHKPLIFQEYNSTLDLEGGDVMGNGLFG